MTIHGNHALVGASSDDELGERAGSAFVLERREGTWQEVEKFSAADTTAGDQFGQAVAVGRKAFIVGASIGDGSIPDTGAAYIYEEE